jgi:4-hydroxy-tetrahydrodipicolinate synthase
VIAGQLVHHYGDVISTFVGWDSLLLAALTEGAAGVMSGSANVIPGHLVSIHRALQKGELDRARREWSQIFPFIDALTSAPYNAAVKAALDAVGFPAGSCRKPILDLDPATAATIAAACAALPALLPAS